MRRPARAAVAALILAAAACASPAPPSPGGPVPTPDPASPSVTPSGASATPDPPVTTTPPAFGYPPLWPFPDAAAARDWQESSGSAGHQPWHLDAAATAIAFASGYLGFTGIDRATSTSVSGDQAWVGVGFALPDGADATAAVVHLARIGTGDDAPWEVVGTRDDTLTIDTPRYGATVTSPATAGGVITGVDESLHVRVLGPGGVLGDACCTPAGGEGTRWSVPVAFTAAPGALTVVVSTGGHVAEVERFAVTAVRAG